MDAINKSTFLAVGMQVWKVLVFGAVQGKKHIGLWEGDYRMLQQFFFLSCLLLLPFPHFGAQEDYIVSLEILAPWDKRRSPLDHWGL
jgi:uncharacterized membrane protein YiaA